MTPNEIRNKTFDKGMSGYKVEEVRMFLDKIADYVEDLQEEKADIQKKLEVLAEKVEEYREDEDSLRAALIGAQKLGDSVVRDSKKKAEAIMEEATKKANSLVADARGNIHREEKALTEMQREVAKFKSQILTMYKQHIEMIKQIPFDEGDIPQQQVMATVAAESATLNPDPPQAVGMDPEIVLVEDHEDDDAGAVLRFDDFRTNAMEAIDSIERRKSSKFGHLNEYFGDNNPITRE